MPALQGRLFSGKGGGLILLDGLDEVPEAGSRRRGLLDAIQGFAGCLPDRSRVLLTARPYAYADPKWHLTGFGELALAPFDTEQVELSMKDGAPVGPVNAVLEIQTNHPKAKTVPVKVFGVVRALLHVTPSQVQFGSVAAKKRPGRNLIIVNNRSGGVSVNVESASVNDAAFAAEVVTIEQGRRYQVTVTVKPEATPGSRDAVLTIKTSDTEFPEVEVPVRANIS